MPTLTTKQRRFVIAYLGKANGNATEAARVAGYADPNAIGAKLLQNCGIREAIVAAVEDAAISATEVLARLSDIATGDLSDFVDINKDGSFKINLYRAKRGRKTHLIKSLKPNQFGVAIELHDPHAALEKLGRYYGLFAEKPPADAAETDPSRTRAILEQKLAGFADRRRGQEPS